ncbi:MAG: ABC transporter six-transmembrane domain-containing protein [Pseudomonadota bacterium]
MSQPLTHGAILRRYKLAIGGTFALLILENVIQVMQPLFLGFAIDGLIAQSYRELWTFVALAMTGLSIGVARRLYDTRAYGRIYRETASETVENENAKSTPVSKVTARANFVSEFAEFFELYLPMALSSVASLIGAVVMLFFISPLLGACAFGVGGVVGLVFFISRNAISTMNTSLNNEMERQVEVLEERNPVSAGLHFSSIVRWRIRLSDLEARNFGIAFGLTIVLAALAVFILIVREQASEGTVFAALTYILQFSEAAIILPYSYQQFIRTREISARLAS